jgi:type IX secretion system PorP/SprF family membrane protein
MLVLFYNKKKMIKNGILVIACLVASFGYSQQLAQYSQYLRNQYLVNPGAAGVYNFTDATVGGRMQWAGFTNAPMTSYISVSSPFGDKLSKEKYNPGLRLSTGPAKSPEIKTGKMKHASGFQLVADEYGAFRKIQFAGTYAIHIPITKNYNLSLGTKVGMTNHTFLKDRAVTAAPTLDNTYAGFIANQGNVSTLDVGLGLYFYSSRLFFGLAADQLTGDMVRFGNGTAEFQPKVHYNVTGGYKFSLGDNFEITPAFLMKYKNPITPTIEGSVQLEYGQWIWVAGSYRHKDAFVAMFGFNISRRLKFGYSYDFSISKFKSYSSGGHELILGIMLR